jgi:hypothetical protein
MPSVDIASVAASVLTPLAVVVVGYWLDLRLKAYQAERAERLRSEAEERRQRVAEIERRHEPHIEFTLDAAFYGPVGDVYLVEFVIHAHNKSLVRHEFERIELRVRGLTADEQPTLFDDESREHRLVFPEKLFETDVMPGRWNYLFVEPGVKQAITFVTTVPVAYAYVLANAAFRYDAHTPHTIERMFPVASD